MCAVAGIEGRWHLVQNTFSVVVVTTLIASTPNGYANQKTVHMLSKVDTIKDLDWCEYLIHSLVTTHRSWIEDSSRKFTGPLLFLTLFYLDRVVIGVREVPRTIPIICLAGYLDCKLQTPCAARLRDMKPKRMHIAWRDTTSTSDSRIFTMRHMEAYTGQDCVSWDTGLQRGNQSIQTGFRHRRVC